MTAVNPARKAMRRSFADWHALSILPNVAADQRPAAFGTRASMLQNGVYEISFQSIDRVDRASAILRDGTILGADQWGAVFAGQWQRDPAHALDRVTLRLQIPPKGELITGFSAGPHGAIVDIVGAFAHDQAGKRAKLEIGGQPLDVELSFISPLPS